MTIRLLKQPKPHFQVHYKKSEQELIPVNDVLNWETRNSKWLFSKRFNELRVAKHWGLTVDKWDAIADEEAKAEMIAHYNIENKIASYEMYLREREQKLRANKKK